MNTCNINFLSLDESKDIKLAFDLFMNENTGKVDVSEIVNSLILLDYKNNNVQIFEFFIKLEHFQKSNNLNGITFEQFQNFINEYLNNKQIYDNLKEIFNILLLSSEDTSTNTLTVDKIYNICNELNENISKDDIQKLINKVTNNNEINFDEFFNLMTTTDIP